MGAVLVVMGVIGYLRLRRRGPDEVRGFLIWYAFAWPFLGVALCAMGYPRLRWLYFVEFALAAGSYGVQFRRFRRRRAEDRSGRGGSDSGL